MRKLTASIIAAAVLIGGAGAALAAPGPAKSPKPAAPSASSDRVSHVTHSERNAERNRADTRSHSTDRASRDREMSSQTR